MNKDGLVKYLLDGYLIDILLIGYSGHQKVWIVEDVHGLHLTDMKPSSGKFIGGLPIPSGVIQVRKIFQSKKDNVMAYLIKSFGLSKSQAEKVVLACS